MAVTNVKALVWSKPEKPNAECSYDHCMAETPWGKYQIEWKSWKDYPSFLVETPKGEILTQGDDNLDSAKQVAQNHFEASVAAALPDKQES